MFLIFIKDAEISNLKIAAETGGRRVGEKGGAEAGGRSVGRQSLYFLGTDFRFWRKAL